MDLNYIKYNDELDLEWCKIRNHNLTPEEYIEARRILNDAIIVSRSSECFIAYRYSKTDPSEATENFVSNMNKNLLVCAPEEVVIESHCAVTSAVLKDLASILNTTDLVSAVNGLLIDGVPPLKNFHELYDDLFIELGCNLITGWYAPFRDNQRVQLIADFMREWINKRIKPEAQIKKEDTKWGKSAKQ